MSGTSKAFNKCSEFHIIQVPLCHRAFSFIRKPQTRRGQGRNPVRNDLELQYGDDGNDGMAVRTVIMGMAVTQKG